MAQEAIGRELVNPPHALREENLPRTFPAGVIKWGFNLARRLGNGE